MTKHTPGPWKVYDHGRDDGPQYGYDIECDDPNADWIAHDIYEEANARLIAAAPDLLEALKSLLDWSTKEYQSNPRIDDQARAAIAKAEG